MNDSAVQVIGDDQQRTIARELVKTVRAGAARHLAHGVSPIVAISPLDLKHALTITLNYSKRMERLQRLARAIQEEG